MGLLSVVTTGMWKFQHQR
ncbi:hypothetical protein [Nostoc sp. CENA543]|nr:hypothetical protein [Nostoc sp. CENA543]